MAEHTEAQVEAARLREVRAIIEQTLCDFDVIGSFTLAGRYGRAEEACYFTASWCKLRAEEGSEPGEIGLRLTSKRADYGGDTDRQRLELEWTLSALGLIAQTMALRAVALLEAAKRYDEATGAQHTPMRRDDPRDRR